MLWKKTANLGFSFGNQWVTEKSNYENKVPFRVVQ